jgi:hypothetical protein
VHHQAFLNCGRQSPRRSFDGPYPGLRQGAKEKVRFQVAVGEWGGEKDLLFDQEPRLCSKPTYLIWPQQKDVTIRIWLELHALEY